MGLGGGGAAVRGLDFRGGGHLDDGWDIPGAQWPQPCTGSRILRFLPGLGKEGPFQVTLLSLRPPHPPTTYTPHQTFLCDPKPGVSRFPGWGLHRAVGRGSRDGEETGTEASETELGPSWAIQVPGFKSAPPCTGSGA